jgi:hypothetical protein
MIALKNAIARGLQFKVFVDTLKPSSRFYAKRIAELISDYMKANNLKTLDGYLFAHGAGGSIEKDVIDSVSTHILSLNSTTLLNASPDTKKRKRSKSDKPSKPKPPPPPLLIGPDGVPIKRKRGRPRKYPLPIQQPVAPTTTEVTPTTQTS